MGSNKAGSDRRIVLSLADVKALQIYDLHVHIGPEIVPRRYSAQTLAEELAAVDMGAVVKNHFVPTTYLVSGVSGTTSLTPSVTLNVFCGGIHVDALRNATSGLKSNTQQRDPDKSRLVVWMPTLSAKAHLDYYGRDLDPAWGVSSEYSVSRQAARAESVLGEDGRLTEACRGVLEEIAANDYVLCTGHLSREEIFALVERAVETGVRRIVVTHAWFPANGLSVEDQIRLSRLPGVYIEHCWFVSIADHIPLEKYVESIRAVGAAKTVLSTDGGQMVSDPIPTAWRRYIGDLQALGVDLDAIRLMASENPRRLLFGDPE